MLIKAILLGLVGIVGVIDSRLIGRQNIGRPLILSTLAGLVLGDVRQAKVERIHPHKFRRTMATRAIDKGMPVEQVQKLLGHSQIDTTMQYAIVNQSNVKESHRKYIA